MAMAALRQGARTLACQRPPAIFRAAVAPPQRRFVHVGPPAVSRTFPLAEAQRRLFHGGRPAAAGQTYARPRRSNHRITYQERLKPYVELSELLKKVSMGFFKLSCFGLGTVLLWNDLKGPRHVPRITRVLLGLDHVEERLAGGGKESEAEPSSS